MGYVQYPIKWDPKKGIDPEVRPGKGILHCLPKKNPDGRVYTELLPCRELTEQYAGFLRSMPKMQRKNTEHDAHLEQRRMTYASTRAKKVKLAQQRCQ